MFLFRRNEWLALVSRPTTVSVARHRPEVVEPHPERLAAELDADQLAVDALRGEPDERVLADEVRRELDEALHPAHVQRRVLHRHVVAVVEDPGLEPPLVARRDRTDPVRRPRLHHAVPELDAPRAVPQVDLVAHLAGPARPRDDDRDPVQVALPAPVVRAVPRPPRRAGRGSRPGSADPAPGAGSRRARGSARRVPRTPAPQGRTGARPSRRARARSGSRPGGAGWGRSRCRRSAR